MAKLKAPMVPSTSSIVNTAAKPSDILSDASNILAAARVMASIMKQRPNVKLKALNAKLAEYLQDPKDSLDLSGIGFGGEGAKVVAAFLPKW
jgi:hypothetical protein